MHAPSPVQTGSLEPDQLIPTEAELRAKRKDGPEYVVEKLLPHRRDETGTLYFIIKWAGYEGPT